MNSNAGRIQRSTDNRQISPFDGDPRSLAVADWTYPDRFPEYLSPDQEVQPTISLNGQHAINRFNGHAQGLGNYDAMSVPVLPNGFTMNHSFVPAFSSQDRSMPFQYTYPDLGPPQTEYLAQEEFESPHRILPNLQSSPSHSYNSTNGHGKIHFIRKLDIWGETSTWTPLELAENRRIIRFHRTIRNDAIVLDSEVIQAGEYKEDMITISCIRWAPPPANEPPHRLAGKCVFTSVDIIMLMEKLVDFQFLVQEKNRIRRNLEGFRPETVKKDGNTQRFFNQVMNYVQPKTRNIEKDIKVFMWSDVGRALKKIVAKYRPHGGVELGRPTAQLGAVSAPYTAPATLMHHHSPSTESLCSEQQLVHNHSRSYQEPYSQNHFNFQHDQFRTSSAPERRGLCNGNSHFDSPVVSPRHPLSNLVSPPARTEESATENEASSASSISPQSQVALQSTFDFDCDPFMKNDFLTLTHL